MMRLCTCQLSSASQREPRDLLSNQILRLGTQRNIVWEVQTLTPVDNLPVRVMAILRTEWRPTHQTLEHDSSQTPPIAVEAVSVPREDLGCNVVGSAHGGVSHQPSASSPIIDLGAIRHGQIDLVEGDRVTIARPIRFALQKLLVVVVVMELVKASG